jgi:hypothetical protein
LISFHWGTIVEDDGACEGFSLGVQSNHAARVRVSGPRCGRGSSPRLRIE